MATIPENCPYSYCPHHTNDEIDRWQEIIWRALNTGEGLFLHKQRIMGRFGSRRYEVLARLQHQGAVIPAGDWIEAVEADRELAIAFDWHILEMVCTEGILHNWQAWVNLSPQTLRQGNYAAKLKFLLEAYQIEPKRICLEVTEHTANEGIEAVIGAVRKRVGCEFAIDDLGAGYSNLDAIANLPVQFLKIDGPLCSRYQEARTSKVLRALAGLGKELGVGVLAEWVEHAQQLEVLADMGITFFQGWFIDEYFEKNSPHRF